MSLYCELSSGFTIRRMREAFCGVYAILSYADDRVYIGSAVNVARRWAGHRSTLRLRKHRNRELQAAWNRFGSDNFLFVTLLPCAEGELAVVERAVEREYRGRLYNERTAGRFAGRAGVGAAKSDEHKRKISAALKGKPHSSRAVARMRAALTGRKISAPRSAETRAKLSAANAGQVPWIKGLQQDEAHRARIQAARQRWFAQQKGRSWPDLIV